MESNRKPAGMLKDLMRWHLLPKVHRSYGLVGEGVKSKEAKATCRA